MYFICFVSLKRRRAVLKVVTLRWKNGSLLYSVHFHFNIFCFEKNIQPSAMWRDVMLCSKQELYTMLKNFYYFKNEIWTEVLRDMWEFFFWFWSHLFPLLCSSSLLIFIFPSVKNFSWVLEINRVNSVYFCNFMDIIVYLLKTWGRFSCSPPLGFHKYTIISIKYNINILYWKYHSQV